MKRLAFVLTALLLLAAVPAQSRPPKEPQGGSVLMKQKLRHTQKVLEGIAVRDFDLIADNAEELIRISNAAEWAVLKTPQYKLHSNEFRRKAEALIKSAKDRNLDAAALAYLDLTMNCVRCHKYVREVRMTRLDGGRFAGE